VNYKLYLFENTIILTGFKYLLIGYFNHKNAKSLSQNLNKKFDSYFDHKNQTCHFLLR